MPNECMRDCATCGKCGKLPLLDSFRLTGQTVEARTGFGVAVDLGTTSVVLALVDLSSGRIMARHSFLNPQRAYGPDVISRINAANNGALAELQHLITESIFTGLDSFKPYQPGEMVVAGNTTMIHLLLGLSCSSLGVSPFKPIYKLDQTYPLFGSNVTIPCWLAGFVGGDVTAGLLHVLPERKERFLLIDLGTNGEMAYYDRGRLTVTATAAGPAFESGQSGASETIGELARLVKTGDSILTHKQVSELQLAKSAVRSGLEILLENQPPLDAVYLAGGIGTAMNAQDAACIGLIPPELVDQTIAVGNASLGGAVRLLLAPSRTAEDMKRLLADVTEINLAAHPRFNDLFMEHMSFEPPTTPTPGFQ